MKHWLICLSLLFVSSITTGQVIIDYNNIVKQYTVASPEVYNFEKYSLNPVNYYVGKPQISVPIHTIQSGDIVYPLQLVYDAGGIKVDQLASDVGLGWNLTSCLITRTVNHDNDFDNIGSLTLKSNYASYSEADKNKSYDLEGFYHVALTGQFSNFFEEDLERLSKLF